MSKLHNEQIRLNKYIANSGYCSRRKADEYIANGSVKVNGIVIDELGARINMNDHVTIGKIIIKIKTDFKYYILNKPKDTITSLNDEFGRRTVIDLLPKDTNEGLKPIGRLDRNTTGVIILTNDGEMINQLTHPSNEVVKIYQATLDKKINEEDFLKITEGAELEDGSFKPDEVSILEGKNNIGIQIHSGKNRIVRRYFEHFGYEVIALDRVYFAGLTKLKLPRGKCRELTSIEIKMLKSGGKMKV